jgi:hypothetical protein
MPGPAWTAFLLFMFSAWLGWQVSSPHAAFYQLRWGLMFARTGLEL